MLFAKLEASALERTLGKLMDQLQNKLPLFKTWGRAVELKAKTEARGYGGDASRAIPRPDVAPGGLSRRSLDEGGSDTMGY